MSDMYPRTPKLCLLPHRESRTLVEKQFPSPSPPLPFSPFFSHPLTYLEGPEYGPEYHTP